MRRRSHGNSLRRRILFATVGTTLALVLGATVAFSTIRELRLELAAATETYLEEQEIAHRISRTVVRQLLVASSGAARGDPAAWAAFTEAGNDAYEAIQSYLFRSLSAEQRLQLERVKRQHQYLEVAAAGATDLQAAGEIEAADEARVEVFRHASGLLLELESFMAMREEALQELRAGQDRIFNLVFLSAGALAAALVVISVIVARFLHRHVSAPLAELEEATGRLGEGELDTRIQRARDDEFGAVAKGFNRMAEKLSSAQARLEGRNEELAQALARLGETQADLVQAEKMSAVGRMTAGLAHELNNPLASVYGYAELLVTDLARDGSQQAQELLEEYVQPLYDEASRARSLVRTLLRFSRKPDTEIGPVKLLDAVRTAERLRRSAFQQSGLELQVADVPDVWVHAQDQRLQDVILNFINNAYDALTGPTGGDSLRIHGTADDAWATLHFDDDGPGLVEPDRVFEPFYTTKEVGEGTGLGLSLARRFVGECGGTVVAGPSADGGARFTLRLPVVPAPAEATGERNSTPRLPIAEGRDTVVLVVDDEPHLRRLQERILNRSGCSVIVAESVARAREVLGEQRVDLVVSDIRMPGGSGIELYDWVVRKRPELKDRFLFVTGDVGGADTQELHEKHPGLFIQKPFDVSEYVERVSAVLRKGREEGP